MKKTKDRRINVISIAHPLDNIRVEIMGDIVWPCLAYNVTVPVRKQSDLNIFESLVLKLVDTGMESVGDIATISGLNSELIRFIQHKLVHKELLTKNLQVTATGGGVLNELNDDYDQEENFDVVTVFLEMTSGKILPFVCRHDIRYQQVEGNTTDKITFTLGTSGKGRPVSAWKVRYDDQYFGLKPDARDVMKAMKEFGRRMRMTNIVTDSYHRSTLVPGSESLTIQDHPEMVYLHCKALMQKGSSSIIVSDGTGLSFSSHFTGYLNQHNPDLVLRLKKSGINNEVTKPKNGEVNVGDTKPYRGIKSNTHHKLHTAARTMSRLKAITVEDANSEHQSMRYVESIVIDLYAAIEWALLEATFGYETEVIESDLLEGHNKENDLYLQTLAEKIGFNHVSRYGYLLKWIRGRVNRAKMGDAELRSCLALCTLGATLNKQHPLNRLAMTDPDFLRFISDLTGYRNAFNHGDRTYGDLSVITVENYYRRAVRAIRVLLPKLNMDLSVIDAAGNKPLGDVDQSYLKAEVEMETFFGLPQFCALPQNLRTSLINVELKSHTPAVESGEAGELIIELASAMQLAFLEGVIMLKDQGRHGHDIKAAALDRLLAVKLVSSDRHIPKSISAISDFKVEKAVGGLNETLGANMLAYVYLSTDERLKRIGDEVADLVYTIERLSSLRGHGNQISVPMDQAEAMEMKNKVMTLIKMVLEA